MLPHGWPHCPRGGLSAYGSRVSLVRDERQAEVLLPGQPASVPAARRFVRQALTSWGEDAVLDDAMLVVSELITNAVLHAQGEVTVRVTLSREGSVQVDVVDGSARLPRARGYGGESTTGRGLRMVADIAQAWGVEPGPAGKRVWARLAPGMS